MTEQARQLASEVAATTSHWPGCGIGWLTLFGTGTELTWYTFCRLPEGVVTATVDARTGLFRASPAPPAQPPPTALPSR